MAITEPLPLWLTEASEDEALGIVVGRRRRRRWLLLLLLRWCRSCVLRG
jgi:hypothetical protein